MDAQEFLSPPRSPSLVPAKTTQPLCLKILICFQPKQLPRALWLGILKRSSSSSSKSSSCRSEWKGWMMIYADSPAGLVSQRPADAMCNVMTPGVVLRQIPIWNSYLWEAIFSSHLVKQETKLFSIFFSLSLPSYFHVSKSINVFFYFRWCKLSRFLGSTY